MTHLDFVQWHERMGYTYDTGAEALGVNRSTYANLVAGISRTTGKPVEYDKRTALACAALERGIAAIGCNP